MSCPGCGRAFEELDPRLFSFNSPHGWCEACGGFGEIWNESLQQGEEESGDSMLENELNAERQFESVDEGEAVPCPECHGSRLNPVARHVRLHGKTIDEFGARSAGEALALIGKLRFRGTQKVIAADLVPEIEQRLRFMQNVGLGYLALGRSAKTLSGGESQRIRLAAQLGSNLRGVLYVLDEPTIGLHPRDNLAAARNADRVAAERKLARDRRARRRNDAPGRSHHRSRAGRGNAWRRSGGAGDLGRDRTACGLRDRKVPQESTVSSDANGASFVRRRRAVDRDSRGAREQFERRQCAVPGRAAFGHHGHFRLGEIDADARGNSARRARSSFG